MAWIAHGGDGLGGAGAVVARIGGSAEEMACFGWRLGAAAKVDGERGDVMVVNGPVGA